MVPRKPNPATTPRLTTKPHGGGGVVSSAVSLPHRLWARPWLGVSGCPPGEPPELRVLVLPLGLYRLPTESISLEQTMGGIYSLGDRADPLNSLP